MEKVDIAKEVLSEVEESLGEKPSEDTARVVESALGDKEFTPKQGKYFEKVDFGKEESIRLQRQSELTAQDEIRGEMERLYLESHPDENADIKARRTKRDEEIIIKSMDNARQPVGSEKDIVLEESKKIIDFLAKLGVRLDGTEEFAGNVFIIEKNRLASAARAGGLGDSENRFTLVTPSKLKGFFGKTVLDHEFLHNSQSKELSNEFIEGLTCYFSDRAQTDSASKLKNILMNLGSAYAFEYLKTYVYASMLGSKKLENLYFNNKEGEFIEAYDRTTRINTLALQRRLTRMSRNMLRNSRNAIELNLKSIPAVAMDMSALALSLVDRVSTIGINIEH